MNAPVGGHSTAIAFRQFILIAGLAAAVVSARGNAKHVVVLVWDGMRPDFVTEQTTPTLFQLAQRGVVFQNHHSVFVTSTEVNGTALATGMNPVHSGIIANVEYRPAIDPFKPIGVEDGAAVRRGDVVTQGNYLRAATVAEILRAQRPALDASVAGSKAVALLLDRKPRDDGSPAVLLVEGETLPASAKRGVVMRLGVFPPAGETKVERDTWTARALLEQYWADGVPAYSHLWLAEPDWAQHHTGPGSATSLAAIAGCDRKLASVLAALASRHALDDTDIMIVSDHGFSTISRNADLALDLSTIGLTTARAFTGNPSPGTILVTGLGGSSGLYVTGHDPEVIRRAVAFLQTRDYTGAIFTRKGADGTFPLSLVKIDTPDAPDILVALRWTSDRSTTGTAGQEVSEQGAGRKAGQGTHAGLSPFDLHNTLIAAGPDFRPGLASTLPSGNADIAPTVLWILGVTPPWPMDGRVLTEALTIPGPPAGLPAKRRAEAEQRIGVGVWRQYLDISEVNGVSYFDEGNGELAQR